MKRFPMQGKACQSAKTSSCVVVVPQSTSKVLGECDQEPTVCVRHPQEQHHGRLSVSSGANFHGFVLDVGAPPGQRLPFKQAAVRQGHSQL